MVRAELVDAGRWAAGPLLASRFLVVGAEMGAEPGDVQGHSNEDVLNVGFGQATVAGVSQIGTANSLGDGAFHPSTQAMDCYGVVFGEHSVQTPEGVHRHGTAVRLDTLRNAAAPATDGLPLAEYLSRPDAEVPEPDEPQA